jgi:hypothetical protein
LKSGNKPLFAPPTTLKEKSAPNPLKGIAGKLKESERGFSGMISKGKWILMVK